jgi:uridine kinase
VPNLPALDRAEAIEQIADVLAKLRPPVRVAIDGVDAAGKTTLADELAGALRVRGIRAERICADDFLRPKRERYRRGRESPEGYYLDSFDHDAIRRATQEPKELALVDGIFLMRPELNDLWDFRVLVDVPVEESIRRGVRRDADRHGSLDSAEGLYRRRYAPAQRRYFRDVDPRALADVIVDNREPSRPRLIWLGQAAGITREDSGSSERILRRKSNA